MERQKEGTGVEGFSNRDIGPKDMGIEGREGLHKVIISQPMVMPKRSKSVITHLNFGNLPEISEAIKNTRPDSGVVGVGITKI